MGVQGGGEALAHTLGTRQCSRVRTVVPQSAPLAGLLARPVRAHLQHCCVACNWSEAHVSGGDRLDALRRARHRRQAARPTSAPVWMGVRGARAHGGGRGGRRVVMVMVMVVCGGWWLVVW